MIARIYADHQRADCSRQQCSHNKNCPPKQHIADLLLPVVWDIGNAGREDVPDPVRNRSDCQSPNHDTDDARQHCIEQPVDLVVGAGLAEGGFHVANCLTRISKGQLEPEQCAIENCRDSRVIRFAACFRGIRGIAHNYDGRAFTSSLFQGWLDGVYDIG